MQHAKFKSSSDTDACVRTLASFAVAVLAMVGIGGTVYKLAAPGGWLAQLLGQGFSGGPGVALALAVIGLSFWLIYGWASLSGRNGLSGLPVYVCAGAGVLYALQMVAAR